MNSQFLNIIRQEVQKALGKNEKIPLSRYQSAKKAYQSKKSTLRTLRDSLFIVAGVLSAGFGLQGFLIPNGFIDGGVTGISLLIKIETDFSLALLIIIINLPFILLGWRQVNPVFGLKSIIAISLLAIVVVV